MPVSNHQVTDSEKNRFVIFIVMYFLQDQYCFNGFIWLMFFNILSLSILGKPWKLQECYTFSSQEKQKKLWTKYHSGVNTEQENPIPVLQHKQVECLSKNWLEKVMKLIIIDTITYPSKWHTFLNWPATKTVINDFCNILLQK